MMRHHRGHNVLIRLCEGKCDFRNGHGSEPDMTYIFHRKVVESSRQLTTGSHFPLLLSLLFVFFLI
jgi:hypothetical protein